MLKHHRLFSAVSVVCIGGVLLECEPAGAATICMGPDWSSVSSNQKSSLRNKLIELNKISGNDVLSSCGVPSGLAGAPDPKKLKKCMNSCEDFSDGVSILCLGGLFSSALDKACKVAEKAAGRCATVCKRRYGG